MALGGPGWEWEGEWGSPAPVRLVIPNRSKGSPNVLEARTGYADNDWVEVEVRLRFRQCVWHDSRQGLIQSVGQLLDSLKTDFGVLVMEPIDEIPETAGRTE